MQCRLGGLVFVAGCSFIYNTGKIPPQQQDATIDSPIDPTQLQVIDVSPSDIDEGKGDGGSRPLVLVIQGANMVQGAQVTVMGASNIEVDNSQATVSHNGTLLAVPVTIHVDPSAPEGKTVVLGVQVTQGPNTKQVPTGPTLHAHDELTASTTMPAKVYSKIVLSADFTLAATGSATPFVLHSMSSIQVGAITARGGDGTSGAAGAGLGGAGALPGGGQTSKGGGTGGGNQGADGSSGVLGGAGSDGGGAGFAAMGSMGGGAAGGTGGSMYGDDVITAYTANAPSGGGGGGRNAGAVVGSFGNAGGGGGGGSIVELTAGGNLTCGAIDVGGGKGGDGASGTGGGGGGGGAGGVIVLRAGGALMSGTLSASGGSGGAASGTATGNGGTGSVGRIRWDNASASSVNASPTAVRGPSFDSPPLITSSQTLKVVGAPGKVVTMFVNGGAVPGIGLDGNGKATVTVPLTDGYNNVCIVPENGDQSLGDCIDLAYLP